MDFRINTDGMIAFRQNTGFCHMIAFFIDIFRTRALGSIPNKAQSFEFVAIRFDDITVIQMNHRLIGNPFADDVEIRA